MYFPPPRVLTCAIVLLSVVLAVLAGAVAVGVDDGPSCALAAQLLRPEPHNDAYVAFVGSSSAGKSSAVDRLIKVNAVTAVPGTEVVKESMPRIHGDGDVSSEHVDELRERLDVVMPSAGRLHALLKMIRDAERAFDLLQMAGEGPVVLRALDAFRRLVSEVKLSTTRSDLGRAQRAQRAAQEGQCEAKQAVKRDPSL